MATSVSRSPRRAVALLELSLILPLLLMLSFGIMEYGWMLMRVQQITGAARHGARKAVTVDATNAEVTAAIAALMQARGMGGSGYTVTLAPLDVSAVAAGETVSVTIDVDYANVDLGLPFIPTPGVIRASASMAKEGVSPPPA